MDPLRDLGFIYEEDIRKAGVETKVDVFPGLIHGFWTFFPQAEFSRDFKEKSRDGFRWLLAAGGKEGQ
jgi:acetyl esterase/lipase